MAATSGVRAALAVAAVAGAIALAGCGDLLQEPDTGTLPVAVTIEPISGSGQTGAPGAPLATPLKVRLLDHDGRPIPRLRVEWTPLPGSGEARPRNTFSGADGIAETTWILGPSTGPQTIQALVRQATPMTFNATSVAP